MEFKEIKSQRHYLFNTKEEFYGFTDTDTVVRSNWRDGSQDEWILTDDNYVCQILKKFKVGKNDCVRTVCGTFNKNNKKSLMLGANGIAEHIYSFSGKQISPKQRGLTERHFLFAKYIVTGDTVIDAFKKAFPRSKSEDYIKRTSTSLIKTENIKKMINEEIRAILDEEGVTPQYQIRSYKQVADLAEKDTDKLANAIANMNAASAVTAIDRLAVDINKLGPNAKAPLESLQRFMNEFDKLPPASRDTLGEIVNLAEGMKGLDQNVINSLHATLLLSGEAKDTAIVMSAAQLATQQANEEVFMWATALDQASASMSGFITQVNREISNSEAAFGSLFSVTTNVPNIKAAGVAERRGRGIRNEAEESGNYQETLANISDFQKALPAAMQKAAATLTGTEGPSEVVKEVIESGMFEVLNLANSNIVKQDKNSTGVTILKRV